MRVACVQMCSGTDVAGNVEAASDLIRAAAGRGAEFIATPEMTHLLQANGEALRRDVREEREDEGLRAFRGLSKELGVKLLIGSLAIREGSRLRNRSFLIGPDGNVRARYDKMHMFDADVSATESWRESQTYAAGDAPVTASVGDWKLGLSVCFDLRFAELYRTYARLGCTVVSVPSAFTVPTGRAHWEVLLRARAIEMGAYVLAPAQGGQHADRRQTWGHSLVVGPWGEVVAEKPDDRPGIVIADLDLCKVAEARGRIPTWGMAPKA